MEKSNETIKWPVYQNLRPIKVFSINLNVQHVNGMTHFDLAGDNNSRRLISEFFGMWSLTSYWMCGCIKKEQCIQRCCLIFLTFVHLLSMKRSHNNRQQRSRRRVGIRQAVKHQLILISLDYQKMSSNIEKYIVFYRLLLI